MKHSLEFHWEVQPEVDSSFHYYERERSGLGREFLDAVEVALAEIVDHPSRYAFAEDDIREYVLNRFPFAIYYRMIGERVRVLAVYHSSRDPEERRLRR